MLETFDARMRGHLHIGERDVQINRNIILWVMIAILGVMLFQLFQNSSDHDPQVKMPYSSFIAEVEANNVRETTIQGNYIHGILTNGVSFVTYAPNDPAAIDRLLKAGVTVQATPEDTGSPLVSYLTQILPFLLLIGIWIFFMRQMQSGGGRAMGFSKSRARLLQERKDRITFADVAGIDEAQQELQEIVDYLRTPLRFQRLGGKIPKGCLLIGPPGTGKTLLARAIAGEANVPFFSISGSDFVEMFVGVGASRVRDMFEQGKKSAPCIIFIDEIDAVGRHRGAGLGGGNDEREQTLNQLLVEMDGFESAEGVILIAATNRPDVLDPALLRPGRFDRQIIVPNPDIIGREKILRVHMRDVPTHSDVDTKTLARGTPGFSGADLANLINEAALLAARRDRPSVTMLEFENAKDKVMMGVERKSMVMSEEERNLTAYHEAGHALIMMRVEGHEPLHKVSIIPRGRALGVTFALPERDRLSHSFKQLNAMLVSLFGGRIAEDLVFGEENITTGASDDIRRATKLARAMVTEYGFSSRLGRLRYASDEEEIFLGHAVTQRKNVSDATAQLIDEEIRNLIELAEVKARQILADHIDDLHVVAKGLLEFETLSAEEIRGIIKGVAPERPSEAEIAATPDSTSASDQKLAKQPSKSRPSRRPPQVGPGPAGLEVGD